ncbi:MAG: Gfo/Idh/MocA family oxidoreductase [Betaproteobacteria bacterium]
MSKLQIAVAGAGLMGRSHAELLARSAQAELSAVVDPLPAGAELAGQWGVPYFENLQALLAQAKPDGVILATPNHLHVQQALACIEAGLGVLVEKPVASTLAEGELLLRAVQTSSAPVLVGHHRAHSPIMEQARQVAQSGRLGRLVAVMGSATFFKPEHYFADGPWRSQKGGGPILINMIHEVHNLRMLCGEIIAVQAMASNAVRGFPVEDTVSISLRFASGALGSFLLSDTAASARSWEQTSQENKAYPSYGDEDCYVLTGTLGSLSVPSMRLKTYPSTQDASWWKPFACEQLHLQREDPLARQLDHFVQVLRGQAQPLVTVRDGLQNLRVSEAIAESAHSGHTIDLQ